MSQVEEKIENITPNMATKYLRKNKKNRNISRISVERYAESMENGSWKYNAFPIVFDQDGLLMDGQHRLHAIILSGHTIKCKVVRGMDSDVFSTIDIGKYRGKADFLSSIGLKYSVQMAASLQYILNYRKNQFSALLSSQDTSAQEIIDLSNTEENLIESVKFIARYGNKQKILPPSISSAMHYIFCEINPNLAHNFFDQLYTGTNLPPDSPILKLRNKQLDYRINRLVQSRKAVLMDVITCWNCYISGEQMPNIKYNDKNPVPEILSHPVQHELELSA